MDTSTYETDLSITESSSIDDTAAARLRSATPNLVQRDHRSPSGSSNTSGQIVKKSTNIVKTKMNQRSSSPAVRAPMSVALRPRMSIPGAGSSSRAPLPTLTPTINMFS